MNVRSGVPLFSSYKSNPHSGYPSLSHALFIDALHILSIYAYLMPTGAPNFPASFKISVLDSNFDVVQLGLDGVLKERADFEYGFLLDGGEYGYKKLGSETGEMSIRMAEGE
ncbi:hypothetical protein VNO80_11087 [Phaseolus coccineus]|uniref:Uncharacterized protein n=1 Tax=Phaseolus coccineus TaxID=3886 RepID=A0AAN9NFQ7_PHACN